MEIENLKESHEEENIKRRINLWSLTSFLLFLLGGSFSYVFFYLIGSSIFLLLSYCCLFLSILIGLVALLRIKKKQTIFKGKRLAQFSILFSVFWILYLLSIPFINRSLYAPLRERGLCELKLRALYDAIQTYASNHDDQLPAASKWCDLLVNELDISKDTFVCPSSDLKEGQSSYAFNKYVMGMNLSKIPGYAFEKCVMIMDRSKIPENTVLLFETYPGWNATGSHEQLNTNNHSYILETSRCGVLLANGDVLFVQPKDFGLLKWKP